MTEDEIYNYYLNKIDNSRLTRDYLKFPLQKNGRLIEKPNLDDLKYLYLELNLPWNFLNKYFGYKFQEFACSKGLKKSPQLVKEARELTLLFKVGVKNVSNLKEIKEKKAKTCLQHYGVDNPSKSKEVLNKIKETVLKHYNYSSYLSTEDFKLKYKNKMLKKYGVDNPSKVKEVLDKIKSTKLNRYGNSGYHNIEKMWITNEERYNSKYFFGSSVFKEFKKLNLKNELEKSYQTKKLNNSFNKSSIEDKLYNLLLTKYPDTLTQYKSEKYLYTCDFYIPSLDAYIEYNGTWTHGFHPFNENNPEDLKTLNTWKEKSKEINFKGNKKNYYKVAIYTWTDLDVRKRETAKANGLNYYVFYNEKEFLTWYNSL